MKYFIDTEFIEGFHKPLFGKRRHFIDLISIGIVCEDGREYYAISNEFKYNDADDWVKENIIHKLPLKLRKNESCSEMYKRCKIGVDDFDSYRWVTGKYNKQIANEIFEFVCPYEKASEYAGVGSIYYGSKAYLESNPPKFYGYYADYDWVLLCSLFGRMIDLPKGFPMYCIDLKQMVDEKAESIKIKLSTILLEEKNNWEETGEIPQRIINIDDYSLDQKLKLLKSQKGYPKQIDEHNALADAKWNKELYDFLTIKDKI